MEVIVFACVLSDLYQIVLMVILVCCMRYRIAGNFRGAVFSWILWFEACA